MYAGAGNDQIIMSGGISLPAELYGGDGNDSIISGAGPSILVGGAGNDQIIAGNARNLIIGGTGSDQLIGSSVDDILVASATGYDNDRTALNAIMDEWRSSGSFTTRKNHLLNGGGLNGTYRFNNPEVNDDGSADQLIGSSGQDLFIISASNDQVVDAGSSDFVINPDTVA
jgi:Ca2+-binding RTX toxin-like protein